MLNQEHIDLIEKSLAGSLSATEQKVFDELLNTNDSFAKEIQNQQMAHLAIQRLGLLNTATKLDQIRTKSSARKQKLWITGSAILLTSLIGVAVYSFRDRSTELVEPHLVEETIDTRSQEITVNDDKEAVQETVLNNESNVVVNEDASETTTTSLTHNISEVTLSSEVEETAALENTEEPTEETEVNNTQTLERAPDEVEEPTVENTIDCSSLSIYQVKVNTTCSGEETGSIDTDNMDVRGGTLPYETTLKSVTEMEVLDRSDFLPEGEYLLTVKNNNGCSTIKTLRIESKVCTQEISATFSPTYGETWPLPKVGGIDAYELSILDIRGNVIFTTNTQNVSEWDGKNISGNIQPPGVYFLKGTFGSDMVLSGTVSVTQ